jgi:hypothetical protein
MALLGQIYDWPNVEFKESFFFKNLQFVTIFHLLNRGDMSLIMNACKGFLNIFKVEKTLKMDWTNSSGWGMVILYSISF